MKYLSLGPTIIAEIGANHNGDTDLALKMIRAAKVAGADFVKFQSWSDTDFICRAEYARNTQYADAHRHFGTLEEMVKAYQVTPEQHRIFHKACGEVGIGFCSSVFSQRGIDILESLGVPFHKIASMDVTNHDLLRRVGATTKPVIMSCGMATLGEIEAALQVLDDAGCPAVTLLHCVAVYPCPPDDVNLAFMDTLRTAFARRVGFSDHTAGIGSAIAAVARGACVIEKHFTLDKTMAGWDHHISATPLELAALVTGCREAAAAIGDSRRTFSKAEMAKASYFRRSWVTTRDLPAGRVLTADDLDAKRPGTGIPPNISIVGRTLRNTLDADMTIRAEDLV